MSDTRRRIQELLLSAPPFGAPAEQRAAWFDERAEALDRIGMDDPAYACEAADLAQASRDTARRIRAGGVE